MTNLTDLGIAAIRDGVAKGDFSARDVASAFNAAVEAANPALNAFIVTTPDKALEAADRMKANFIQHVSYELRSPLTTIIGFAHFLSDPSTGPLSLKQSEYLSYITSSTNALLAIINNILDLATTLSEDQYTMVLQLDMRNIASMDTVVADLEIFSRDSGLKLVIQHNDIFRVTNEITLH